MAAPPPLLLLATCAWLSVFAAAAEPSACARAGRGEATLSFAVSSRRNASGHRLVDADIKVEEVSRRKLNDSGVHLEVTEASCMEGTVRKRHLKASFIGLPEKRHPPPGYQYVAGQGWYIMHLTPLAWEEARLACEAEGAHLAVLNSLQEAEALKGIGSKAPTSISGATATSAFWLGYSHTSPGTYITIFGESLIEAGYAEWHPGQPNDEAKSKCVGVEKSSFKFNDIPCNYKMIYFCEYE